MKREKGAITLYVCVACLFVLIVGIVAYIGTTTRQTEQMTALKRIEENYKNEEVTEEEIYQQYDGGDIIPIYTPEQFAKVGSGETAYSAETGKVYTFTTDKTYMFYGQSEDLTDVIQNSIYPIGSIYTSKISTNPSEFMEGTTWELIEKNVIDTGWQSFSWTNSTYIGTSQSSFTKNKWRVKDNILYIHVGVGATSNIDNEAEIDISHIPIKGTSFDDNGNRIWNGAVGQVGMVAGFIVVQKSDHIQVQLKSHNSSYLPTGKWYSTNFAIPLDNDFTFTSGSYDTEYKWERTS